MKEPVILTFLIRFPPWIVLLGLTVFFVFYYVSTDNAAFKEWTSLVLASLFTALGIQRQQSASNASANTQSGDVIVSPTEPAESTSLENLTPEEIEKAIDGITPQKFK